MTKRVRIENADTSTWKVLVQVWNKSSEGNPDVLAQEKILTNPTDLGEFYIHSGNYLVVKEPEPS
jgi:hypothetical protein